MITLGDQSTVVTDGQGRFTWTVPAALPPLSDYIGVRSIACYFLAADQCAERLRLTVRPNWSGTDATGAARNLLEQVTRLCETHWGLGGTHPIFSVVVPDWPPVIRADGIGDLHLDGLEAGRHSVQPIRGGPRIMFDVLPTDEPVQKT